MPVSFKTNPFLNEWIGLAETLTKNRSVSEEKGFAFAGESNKTRDSMTYIVKQKHETVHKMKR